MLVTDSSAWRRRAALGITLLGALSFACGCARAYAPPDDVAYATYVPVGRGGDSALLSGVLEVVSGCLVVRESDGRLILPIWPGPRLPAQVGQTVDVRGGFRQSAGDSTIPQVCAALGLEMFQVNR